MKAKDLLAALHQVIHQALHHLTIMTCALGVSDTDRIHLNAGQFLARVNGVEDFGIELRFMGKAGYLTVVNEMADHLDAIHP